MKFEIDVSMRVLNHNIESYIGEYSIVCHEHNLIKISKVRIKSINGDINIFKMLSGSIFIKTNNIFTQMIYLKDIIFGAILTNQLSKTKCDTLIIKKPINKYEQNIEGGYIRITICTCQPVRIEITLKKLKQNNNTHLNVKISNTFYPIYNINVICYVTNCDSSINNIEYEDQYNKHHIQRMIMYKINNYNIYMVPITNEYVNNIKDLYKIIKNGLPLTQYVKVITNIDNYFNYSMQKNVLAYEISITLR